MQKTAFQNTLDLFRVKCQTQTNIRSMEQNLVQPRNSRSKAAFSLAWRDGMRLTMRCIACTDTLYTLTNFIELWTPLNFETAWAGSKLWELNSWNMDSRLAKAHPMASIPWHTASCCSFAKRVDLIFCTFLAMIQASYSGIWSAAWTGSAESDGNPPGEFKSPVETMTPFHFTSH